MNSNRRIVVGVMGGAHISKKIYDMVFELGALIAVENWVLLNGGRDAGVMRAAAEGAKRKGGTTIGILPGDNANQANEFIDFAIVTNMGDARNIVNVLSSDVLVICPGGAGTLSEAALALKANKPLVLFAGTFENSLQEIAQKGSTLFAQTPKECIAMIKQALGND